MMKLQDETKCKHCERAGAFKKKEKSFKYDFLKMCLVLLNLTRMGVSCQRVNAVCRSRLCCDNTDRPTLRRVPYIPRRFLKKIECDSLIDQLSTRINVRFVAKAELNTAHTASRPHTWRHAIFPISTTHARIATGCAWPHDLWPLDVNPSAQRKVTLSTYGPFLGTGTLTLAIERRMLLPWT